MRHLPKEEDGKEIVSANVVHLIGGRLVPDEYGEGAWNGSGNGRKGHFTLPPHCIEDVVANDCEQP